MFISSKITYIIPIFFYVPIYPISMCNFPVIHVLQIAVPWRKDMVK